MKKIITVTSLFLAAILVGACSSMPKTTSLLEQTRYDYQTAQSNPHVAMYASLEIKQAGDALTQANAAAAANDSVEKIDQLAYVAKQKIALAVEVAKRQAAEASVASAGKDRDQVRLEQRTNEADQAKRSAEQSRLIAQDAQARTAQLEAQLSDLRAQKTTRGMVITMGDVLFGSDLARLSSDGMRTAEKLALVLQQNPQRNVLIEGFADSTGNSSYNQELSERRAATVSGVLQEMGIARSRIDSRGYGESYPAASNDTAESRQLNRRVEIVLSDDNGKIMQR